MGDIDGKLPGADEGILQSGQCRIESRRQTSDLVVGIDHFQSLAQVLRADLLGGAGYEINRFQGTSGEKPAAATEEYQGSRNRNAEDHQDLMQMILRVLKCGT